MGTANAIGGSAMDAATIIVLMAIAIVVGFIIWIRMHSGSEGSQEQSEGIQEQFKKQQETTKTKK